jgi:aminopeptidase N
MQCFNVHHFSFIKEVKIDVKEVMDTWTLQMGFPLVTIENKGGKYSAKQEHFLVNPGAKPALESPYK